MINREERQIVGTSSILTGERPLWKKVWSVDYATKSKNLHQEIKQEQASYKSEQMAPENAEEW